MIRIGPDARQRSVVFLLLERFTMMAFASAIEPLRLANQVSGRTLYTWKLASESGADVTCSNGTTFRTDIGLEELGRDTMVLVCGGIDVAEAVSKPLLNWLRREARRGAVMGGLCTGSYALARAGLLDGKRATIHWENIDAFAEDFPDIELTKGVFVIDGNRVTTAGGTASIDLMLRLIARDHGEELANTVADQLIHSSIRSDRDTQRLSIPTRIGVRHPKLAQVIGRMERNIEDPISPATLATEVGMSARQLERLFRRYLNRSPKRYYMELRLQKARNLLMQTEMSVINVAMACGFASPSHFSKCYRAHYQTTPYRERGASAAGEKEIPDAASEAGPEDSLD
ncbi:GlxA family transcriptional regulator [Thioclava nitratireducens]|uniref:AraC family transcriptional regulator n=1 Tax=Thioclava nitratireducens TaxID=1915078 RepID=A0ABN4X775_9RHOB|nr:GlxA family transcriptional regulator [Thioclava nitratireducens]AQS48340.1 AraC family transcriptional regulator [Thioclava nitratireducens]WGT52404.1 GlxA family transcriptional regulator [Thioclava nitratireducens]